MTRNTITKNGKITQETRFFISSLKPDAKEVARAIRGHWMVESYQIDFVKAKSLLHTCRLTPDKTGHLDVTFREDENRTIDKQAAYNLNVLRKLAINTLKLLDIGNKGASLKLKRYAISLNPVKYFAKIMEI